MPAPVSKAEEKRRISAFNSTKTKAHPNGSMIEAAAKLGNVTPNTLTAWLQQKGIHAPYVQVHTREDCIAALKDVIRRTKRIPSRDVFVRVGGVAHHWKSYWPTYAEFLRAAGVAGDDSKILLLDIETAPNLAYVWGTWKQNINPEWIAANGYVLCWTAKWLGKNEVVFKRLHTGKPLALLGPIHKLLSEAHAVIHYNGKKFDVPTLNKEFLTHGMTPPSPYKQIDLLRTMWDTFLFPSNKLDYVSQTLGIGEKIRHKGPQLWIECMAGKEEAWREMEDYNKRDVELLEKLYLKLRPWIKSHPNRGAISGLPVCPTCGSEDFQQDGTHLAQVLKYARYQCSDCGTWFRGNKTVSFRTKEERFRAAL